MSEPLVTSVVESFIHAMIESKMDLEDIGRSIRWAVIRRTLELHHYNQCQTAQALGIHRNTLGRELRRMKAAGVPLRPCKRWNKRSGVTSDLERRRKLVA